MPPRHPVIKHKVKLNSLESFTWKNIFLVRISVIRGQDATMPPAS